MACLEIRIYPDPILRKRSQKLRLIGNNEKKLIEDMVDTMYANKGVGLAASQLGTAKRIIVIDAGGGLLKMANPEITSTKGKSTLEERCLSIPGKSIEIQRAEEISVSFIDTENHALVKSFSGLTARAIQHEIDHLNGKLIVDYLPWYKRLLPKRGEAQCLQ